MDKIKPCSSCGSTHLYRSVEVSAGGGYAPNYLPGLGGIFRAEKFELVVCRDCGLTRFFARPQARAKLSESKRWRPV